MDPVVEAEVASEAVDVELGVRKEQGFLADRNMGHFEIPGEALKEALHMDLDLREAVVCLAVNMHPESQMTGAVVESWEALHMDPVKQDSEEDGQFFALRRLNEAKDLKIDPIPDLLELLEWQACFDRDH